MVLYILSCPCSPLALPARPPLPRPGRIQRLRRLLSDPSHPQVGLLPASLARASTERGGHGGFFFPGASLSVPATSLAHRPDPSSLPLWRTAHPSTARTDPSRCPAAAP